MALTKKSVELLAPAGQWESLVAAIEAGADAVYLGGKAFNMRVHRTDFNRILISTTRNLRRRLNSLTNATLKFTSRLTILSARRKLLRSKNIWLISTKFSPTQFWFRTWRL